MRTITGDVWADGEVRSLARKAKGGMFCVAYVTRCPAGIFHSGDVLVCDASRKAVACGETDPSFLRSLMEMGVLVYSCEALHAKCAVWNDTVLLGSANMSESSSSRLVELSVIQQDQALADQVSFFITGLIEKGAAVRVDSDALRKLARIWASERKPWQGGLAQRKASQMSRKAHKGHFCRFVTVRVRDNGLRGVTEQEISESEDKAASVAQESAVFPRLRALDWYCTTEKNISSKLRAGDSIIVLQYPSSKATRAQVFGPCTVVLVDKRRGRHFVHYMKPSRSMPYRKFTGNPIVRSVADFRFGKSVDRQIEEDTFETFSKVLKRFSK